MPEQRASVAIAAVHSTRRQYVQPFSRAQMEAFDGIYHALLAGQGRVTSQVRV